MSLRTKLWLALALLLAVLFAASVVCSSLAASGYLERQLGERNAGLANALALALAQQQGDSVQAVAFLEAQFDSGFYEMIELTDPQGDALLRQEQEIWTHDAPAWFTRLFPVVVAPGVARVQADWQEAGTLRVRGHSRPAYGELWCSARAMGLAFLVALVVAGLLGSRLLKRFLRPLDALAAQAAAIGERRFVTAPAPAVAEFRKLGDALDDLSKRVRSLLAQEAGRQEKLRKESHVDKVSGLLTRDKFKQALAAAISHDDYGGAVGLVRLTGLARLNQNYGRKNIDGLLSEVGGALNRIVMQNSGWVAGRLNGADFCLLAPRAGDPLAVARELREAVLEVLENRRMAGSVQIPGAATAYTREEDLGSLLTRLDGALQANEAEGESGVSVAGREDVQVMPVREQLQNWRQLLHSAFSERGFSLACYPVLGRHGELLHVEAPLRLKLEERQLTAALFLPWIHRLELGGELDRHVVELALERIEREGESLAINLSVAAVAESSFLMWISEKLTSHKGAAGKLWLELPEATAFRHLENFDKLCTRVRAQGTRVGIEQFGQRLPDIGRLQAVGLDYVKLDAAFAQGIEGNGANQAMVQTLCRAAQAIGAKVIATGVESAGAWRAVEALGVDGVTGPGVTARNSQAAPAAAGRQL
jgi:EAL domain-containing protein (putative c-di-GMP-specific phosphodiesterase class I)/GGDEF domain-containing protein